ncbi:hypothetical protein [Ancylobacter sp. SL191]|uniref:hypothetical protein n=1 Tax=Ancylobacter sp. SL191 TaxID=2995166 RepID=UPI002270B2DC|nr:hypothetical protein [Ancylobacter sp. SL191]WAC26328.1 hypothetical protein OU996_15080 [Ancylobacter sp. SL191]
MPIKRENERLYPGGSIRSPEWRAIRERIRGRAGDSCEECGVPNHAMGGRLGGDGTFLPASPTGDNGLRLTWPVPGEYGWCGPSSDLHRLRIVRIVCTVAHLDHNPAHNCDANLRFLCQRCHNRHDQAHRRANAAATRKAAAATGDLFGS